MTTSKPYTGALIGLLALLLTACATPNRHSDWGVISREVQRTITR